MRIFVFLAVAALLLVGAGCSLQPSGIVPEPSAPAEDATTDGVGLANPASVYCVDEMGGTLKMYTEEAGEVGFCLLDDGRLCEEWKLFYSKGEECVPPSDDMTPKE